VAAVKASHQDNRFGGLHRKLGLLKLPGGHGVSSAAGLFCPTSYRRCDPLQRYPALGGPPGFAPPPRAYIRTFFFKYAGPRGESRGRPHELWASRNPRSIATVDPTPG
jgi:hypothetical protein